MADRTLFLDAGFVIALFDQTADLEEHGALVATQVRCMAGLYIAQYRSDRAVTAPMPTALTDFSAGCGF